MMKLKGAINDDDKATEYFCFICNAQSTDKGLPLLICETTYSNICLGQKLQEILGDKFIVLITSKDSVCWNCACEINWIDKIEMKLDITKEHILEQITKKYKKIEMHLGVEGAEEHPAKTDEKNNEKAKENVEPKDQQSVEEQPYAWEPPPAPTPPPKKGGYVKKKKYPCSVCHKLYATPAAAGAHSARVHTNQYMCEYCDDTFSTEKRYQNHLAAFHPSPPTLPDTKPPESFNLLSCVSCGFKTMNTEVYCRHVCNSAIMSLTCMTCRKRYVDSNIPKEKTLNFQCQSCTKLNPVKTRLASEEVKNPNPVAKPSKKPELLEISSNKKQPSQFFQETKNTLSVNTEKEQTLDARENSPELPSPRDDEDETIIGMPIDPELMEQIEEQTIEEANIIDDMMISGETEVISEKSGQPQVEEVPMSFLKCTNCNEELELTQLANHECFERGDVMEFAKAGRHDVSNQYFNVPIYKNDKDAHDTAVITPKLQNRRRIPKIPAQENAYVNVNDEATKMHCKTCSAEFPTISLMRKHWDMSGHPREVLTTTIELNKIKDKNRKTEKTFKVVKQNFNIRAYVPGQNDDEIKRNEDLHANCIFRFKKDMSVEDFIRMKDGKECETCGILFGSEDLLKEHQRINCLTCVTCSVTFFDNKLLKKHYQYTGHANKNWSKNNTDVTMKDNEPPEFYHCHLCSKSFYSRFILGKHLQKHYRGTAKGACHYCQMEFDDKTQIQQHVLETHGAQLYKCQHCDRTFLSESVRNRHELKHKPNESEYHQCKICKSKFKTQQLLMIHKDKMHRSMSCRICGKTISDIHSLRRHEKRHFYEKGLQCDLCGKLFRNKTSLLTHSKTHAGETQFECKTCSLGFKTAYSLEEHQIAHIKKEYTCPKCSVVCPSRLYFWMHMKLHEAAYKCTVCNRMFRDTSLLAIHRRKHWRVRPYQCPHCPRTFSVPATLRRHITVHTRAYPHRCALCKKGFLTRYAFHKHLDTVHSVKQSQPKKVERKIPSLPFNATDEDIFQAADTLIADDAIMFNDYPQKDITIEQVSSSDLITNEVVVETTELFDEILT